MESFQTISFFAKKENGPTLQKKKGPATETLEGKSGARKLLSLGFPTSRLRRAAAVFAALLRCSSFVQFTFCVDETANFHLEEKDAIQRLEGT